MKFTVIWSPAAEAQPTQLWLAEADRAALRQAADALDRQLAIDPQQTIESRFDEYRVAFHAPLGCYFRIVEADRRVVEVRIYRIKNSPNL